MNRTISKPFLIFALLAVSMLAGPLAVKAETGDPAAGAEDINTVESMKALEGALGQTFGLFRDFGASGEVLAQVFELMFTNFENFTSTTKSDGVFVMNGSYETTYTNQVYNYSEGQAWTYEPWGSYKLSNFAAEVDDEYEDERPYFKFDEAGSVVYNKTEGAQVALIIWDSDGSFVDALDELLSAVKNFYLISESQGSDEEKVNAAIEQAVKTITYFLIHINDIINGDEVIIANVMAYTDYEANILGTSTNAWYVTESGVKTDTVLLETVFPDYATEFGAIAEQKNDYWMSYILDQNWENQRIQNYTTFSFDLIQIWLKQFHIEIDVAAILDAVTQASEGTNPAGDGGALDGKTATDIFDGLVIEFYIFTHSFVSNVLYDDGKFEGTANDAVANNGVPDLVLTDTGYTYENESIDAITDTEISDYLLFRGAEDWEFIEPTYENVNQADFKMSWGIKANNLAFRVLPIGMDDDEVNETFSPTETMDYYELGFSFEPYQDTAVPTDGFGVTTSGQPEMGIAKVKLLQSFGLWNEGAGPSTPRIQGADMDLATIFMSTIFHFKLQIENKELSGGQLDDSDPLLAENNYNNEQHKIKVGDAQNELPLGEIDIAGPEYSQFNAADEEETYAANTTIIPLVYAMWEGQGSETYTQSDNSTAVVSGVLTLEFSVLMYAVSYGSFDSTGDEIIHDPTFSIYIITENPAALAVILVVGVVAIVGLAAMLITKKKNESYGA